MKYYLGIDGGGTRTTAAVSDENGNILLKTAGKTINFYSVGMEAARENLNSIIKDVNTALGVTQFEAVFVGCSALDGEADEELTRELCGAINAKTVKMNSDVYVALKALDKAVCPCVAICGTGSMAIGEDENGNTHIKGGWGHIVGDEGSGYSVAVEALKVCCILCDENKDLPLLKSANEYFGVEDFRKAIDIIYSPETTKDVLAGFAANVGRLASDGDEAAFAIITAEALKFAKTVLLLLDEVKSCSLLGLYGGLFQHNEIFRDRFIKIINKHYPNLKTEVLSTPPEEGALNLAREL